MSDLRPNPVPARLALEDGTIHHGRAFGAVRPARTVAGEVVFNTAMTGYQEAITDPSYAGQILIMTAPMIGNYGVAPEDVESDRPQISGFVVRELSRIRSNHRSTTSLDEWLRAADVPGIEGIDTRALVRHLRVEGAMRGVISSDPDATDEQLVEAARTSPAMAGLNLVTKVKPAREYDWRETRPGRPSVDAPNTAPAHAAVAPGGKRFRVLAIDCGGKENIYRSLTERGCDVHVVPPDVTAEEIRRFNPDGIFVSNGPGDPEAVDNVIRTLREVAGEKPTFGICLGHQLLAHALGAKTYKLKFGHRGANQPVRNTITGRVEITSQNHGFCIDANSLADLGVEVTHVHLNDDTIAGFRHPTRPIFSVQYHPEASPGPHDSAYLFDAFVEMMRTGRPLEKRDYERLQARYHPTPAAVGDAEEPRPGEQGPRE